MNYRELFEEMDPDVIYFNASYMSPALKAASRAGEQAIRARSAPWKSSAQDFFKDVEALREITAKLWNVSANNIALVPSVSYGVETAVRNLQTPKDSVILIAEGEFPSNVYPWTRQAKKSGARVEFVKRQQNESWLQAFTREIQSQKVSVVCCSTCDWSNGDSFELEKLKDVVRASGAAFVVDASQSFGVIPIDVKQLDPDFLFSVGYKWQCGPYGLAYMYVSDRYINGEPLEENWVNRQSSEDFSRLTSYREGYQPGARRFDVGEKSQFIHVPMAKAALQTLLDLNPQKSQSYLKTLTQKISNGLTEHGFEVTNPRFQMGHLLGFRSEKHPSIKIVEHLIAHKIFVSCREPYVRVSPHLYNTMEEVEIFLKVLKKHVSN